MTITKNQILSPEQIFQKTKRIACEIVENNFSAKNIVLAGIHKTGFLFAEILKKELENFCPFKILLCGIQVSKTSFTANISVDIKLSELKNPSVIIVDDVLNTGKTLTAALKPFLDIETSKIQVAVLIDRHHRLFPVSADYVGYSLSTTLDEMITVVFDKGKGNGVYLH